MVAMTKKKRERERGREQKRERNKKEQIDKKISLDKEIWANDREMSSESANSKWTEKR